MPSAAYYRKQAIACISLARSCDDPPLAQRLVEKADEFIEKAARAQDQFLLEDERLAHASQRKQA